MKKIPDNAELTDEEIFARQYISWSNAQRAAYFENQYQVLTRDNKKIARQLDVPDSVLEELRQDAVRCRQRADAEEAARKTVAASAQKLMNETADVILKNLDNTRGKGIYLSPGDILGKKGN